MSDKRVIKEILDKRGVGYSEKDPDDRTSLQGANIIFIKEGMNQVEGYVDFFFFMNFDNQDNLTGVGIYE